MMILDGVLLRLNDEVLINGVTMQVDIDIQEFEKLKSGDCFIAMEMYIDKVEGDKISELQLPNYIKETAQNRINSRYKGQFSGEFGHDLRITFESVEVIFEYNNINTIIDEAYCLKNVKFVNWGNIIINS